MLIGEYISYRTESVTLMSDLHIIAATAKVTLLDIAKQSAALGMGLQNAAPGDKLGAPNNAVQYLLGISEALAKIASECDAIYTPSQDVPPQMRNNS